MSEKKDTINGFDNSTLEPPPRPHSMPKFIARLVLLVFGAFAWVLAWTAAGWFIAVFAKSLNVFLIDQGFQKDLSNAAETLLLIPAMVACLIGALGGLIAICATKEEAIGRWVTGVKT